MLHTYVFFEIHQIIAASAQMEIKRRIEPDSKYLCRMQLLAFKQQILQCSSKDSKKIVYFLKSKKHGVLSLIYEFIFSSRQWIQKQ